MDARAKRGKRVRAVSADGCSVCPSLSTLSHSMRVPLDPFLPLVQNLELFTLTYGAMVAQLLRDYEDPKEVNAQLEQM
jgi:hypothetical protein